MIEFQHYWIWLIVAFLCGLVGFVTGMPLPLCIAVGALMAALTSVLIQGVLELVAFFIVTIITWMLANAIARKRRRLGGLTTPDCDEKVDEQSK
jgi:membrane protein implicated in regulation of membrane protease activity